MSALSLTHRQGVGGSITNHLTVVGALLLVGHRPCVWSALARLLLLALLAIIDGS